MRYRAAAVIVALLVLSATAVFADTSSVALGSVSAIAGPIGGQTRTRVLISFIPSLPEMQNAQVDFALLFFPAFQVTDTSGPVTIEAHRVTTDWDPAGVTWTQPWQQAGGDFDPGCLARGMTAAGDTHSIRLDVTSAVQAWQSGTSNFGLILTRPSFEGDGFASEASNLTDALRSAQVKVYYHNVQQ